MALIKEEITASCRQYWVNSGLGPMSSKVRLLVRCPVAWVSFAPAHCSPIAVGDASPKSPCVHLEVT